MTKLDTEFYSIRVLVLDFLEDVVNEPRADAFDVSSAFEDIVDGIECFRFNARSDQTSRTSGQPSKGREMDVGLTNGRKSL